MKLVIMLLAVIAFSLVAPIPGYAASNFATGDYVLLPKETTIDSDYYAAGATNILNGTVNGDAYLAGGNIVINGTILGDVLAAGGNISVNGKVAGNIRAVGGQIVIMGEIDKNVTVAGGSISIQPPASISGSLTSAAGNLSLLAPIGKGAAIAGGQISINSIVGNDVKASAEQIDVMQDAKINGKLEYWSPNPAHVIQFAVKDGTTFHRTDLKAQQYQKPAREKIAGVLASLGVAWIILSLTASFIIGLIFLHFTPVLLNNYSIQVTTRPWQSLGIGFLTVALLPFALLILFISLIGIPFAFLLIVSFLLLALMNQIFISYTIGKKILPTKNKMALFVGLVLYAIISWIPLVGWMVNALALFIGMGAIVIVKKNFFVILRTKKLI